MFKLIEKDSQTIVFKIIFANLNRVSCVGLHYCDAGLHYRKVSKYLLKINNIDTRATLMDVAPVPLLTNLSCYLTSSWLMLVMY